MSIRVVESLCVPALSPLFKGFADMPPVFATAYLIGFVEWVCIETIKPHLKTHQRSVGVHVNLSHRAATAIGMQVTATVTLSAVNGGRLLFTVSCRDELDLICEGTHERAIVNTQEFIDRAAGRARAAIDSRKQPEG